MSDINNERYERIERERNEQRAQWTGQAIELHRKTKMAQAIMKERERDSEEIIGTVKSIIEPERPDHDRPEAPGRNPGQRDRHDRDMGRKGQ